MKRFTFRLEAVLRIRRLQEDQVRARLIAANRDIQLATLKVQERQQRYDTLPRPFGPTSHEELERSWFTLDAAAGAIAFADDERLAAIAIAEEIRTEWLAARQRTEILGRLRERAREEWVIAARRDEDRLVDELVVARHHRQSNRPHERVA